MQQHQLTIELMRTTMQLLIICALISVTSAYKQNYLTSGQLKSQADIRGELFFAGCYEPICHQDGYEGYGCKAGRCGYICGSKGCYENNSDRQISTQSLGEKKGYGNRFEKSEEKGRSQYRGHAQFSGRVDFSGCTSDHCNSGEYEGYDCKEGRCSSVCKASECHEEKERRNYY